MAATSASRHHDRFPIYHDGDVKIILTGSRQYQVYSNVLETNSPVLRELLHALGPARLSKKAVENGVTALYKLILIENKHEQPAIDYVLGGVELDSSGRAVHGKSNGVGVEFEHGRALPSIFAAYDAVLGAFYNAPIQIGDSEDDPLNHLLSVALDITIVAEYLECVHIITSPIEACLQATGQNLFKAISVNPSAWLSFAYRVHSKVIFREALIHATGQFNTPAIQRAIRNGDIPEAVVQVLQRKGQTLIGYVKMAERHFASYYPTVLMREKTVGRVDRDNIGRANYGNDIIMWIALCVFRHWCADQMAADMTHHAPDIGFKFVKAIQQGGNAYLSRHMMQTQFHQRFPMSPKGMACVEHRLSEIKENVKQWAIPLMQNTARLDVKRFPATYFTSTPVSNQDYPWSVSRWQQSNGDDYIEDAADIEGGEEDGEMTSYPSAPHMATEDVYNALPSYKSDLGEKASARGYGFGDAITREERQIQEEGQAVFRALQKSDNHEAHFQASPDYGDDTEIDPDEDRYELALKEAKEFKKRHTGKSAMKVVSTSRSP